MGSYIGISITSSPQEETMDEAILWILEIIAPAILLIVLIWLVIKVRSNREGPLNREVEEGTRELYAEEEERRREGTDKL
jgi:hypothetical protein